MEYAPYTPVEAKIAKNDTTPRVTPNLVTKTHTSATVSEKIVNSAAKDQSGIFGLSIMSIDSAKAA